MTEPERLRRGKKFHRLVQRFYEYESTFHHEQRLYKANRRQGRADLFLWVDDREDYAVIVEVKNTDWEDVDSRGNVARNLNSHRRQLYNYLDGIIQAKSLSGSSDIDLAGRDRTLGVVYPQRPLSRALQERIETYFDGHGISVVWFDEPPDKGTPAWEAWNAMQRGEFNDDVGNGR